MARKGVFIHIVAALSIFILSWSTYGADLTIKITNQLGEPLYNAVVEVVNTDNQTSNSDLPILIMDQIDKQFSPSLLIAQQGQQVNFPNSDNIRHHVYSFSKAKSFQLKLYSDKPEQPVTFENNGVVVLGCNIHDSMVGYIYIASSAKVFKSDKNGIVRLNNITLPTVLSFWHAMQAIPLEDKALFDIANNSAKSINFVIQTSKPLARNTFGSKFKAQNDQ